MLQVVFSHIAAHAALVTAADGAQDLFWDNAGNVMLVIASVGIIVSLFYIVYQAFRSPFQNRWNTWRIRGDGSYNTWGIKK